MVIAAEQVLVETLVSQAPIEAFDEAVQHRFAWSDVVPFDAQFTAFLLEPGIRRFFPSISRSVDTSIIDSREQLLQFCVLFFQGLQPFGLRHLHAAVL